MTSEVGETVSIVIPLHNEEGNVAPLVDALASVREGGWEVVFVDDGSSDGTLDQLRIALQRFDWIRVVVLQSRRGQAVALKAGFDHAAGQLLITMDGDLQNDPQDIKLIVDRLRKGAEFVIGRRLDRCDRWLDRKLPSWIANRLITWSLRVPFRDIGCGLRGYRKHVVTKLWWWNEFHRYASILAFHLGFSTDEVEVQSHPRLHGKAKYGLGRIGRILRDLTVLLAFTQARGRASSLVGPLLGVGLLVCLILPIALELVESSDFAIRVGSAVTGTVLASWLYFRMYCFRFYAVALWKQREERSYEVRDLLGR